MPLIKIAPQATVGGAPVTSAEWTTRPSGSLVDDAAVTSLSDTKGGGRHMTGTATADDDVAAGNFVVTFTGSQNLQATGLSAIVDIFMIIDVPAAPTVDGYLLSRDTSQGGTTKPAFELLIDV